MGISSVNNSLTVCGRVDQFSKSISSYSETGKRAVKFISVAVKEYGAKKSESTLWIDVDA